MTSMKKGTETGTLAMIMTIEEEEGEAVLIGMTEGEEVGHETITMEARVDLARDPAHAIPHIGMVTDGTTVGIGTTENRNIMTGEGKDVGSMTIAMKTGTGPAAVDHAVSPLPNLDFQLLHQHRRLTPDS